MTNGEMIQRVFNCEVCEPIIEDDIIHVIFADKKDSAIGFDWSWWNAEYKEPTARKCFGCKYSKDNHNAGTEECHLCMWEKQYTPTTKNDLIVDCISRIQAIERLKLNFPISDGADNSRDRHRYMQALADIQAIRELPSETPQERIGHWVKTPKAVMGEGYMWYCDKCGHQVYQDSSKPYPSEKFCPNCGADMRELEE